TLGVFLDEGETNSEGQFQYFGAVDAGFNVSSAPGTLNGVPVRGVNDPTGRGPTTIFVNDFTRKEDQIAVFGELTFDFTDTFSASIGARWYDLDFNLGGSTGSSFGCKGGAPMCDGTGFDNRVSQRHEALGLYNQTGDRSAMDDFFGVANTDNLIAAVNDGSFNISGLGPDGTANQSDTILRATLNWSLSDGVMVFGTYSEGFRPQTTNRNAGAFAGNQTGVYQGYAVPAVAKTDELTNYEIGLKSDILGGSMRLNATAFWSEITELQTTRFDPSNVAFLVFIENVGDAEISGIDADLTWAATDRWTFNAAFSFVNTELTRINPQLVGVSVPEGSDLPFTPDFSGNLRARYDWPLNDFGGDAYISGSVAYTGERKASIIGNAYFAEDVTREVYNVSGTGLKIAPEGGNFGNLIDPTTGNPFLNGRYVMDAYTLVNLAAGFTKDEWGAELYVNNVTDEAAQIFINTQDYHPRVTTNRPRSYGLRLFFDFE
ncbi:MAG: TonB-dependent receptor, partial [Gammaproteobacteria bacterium]|nr:TonB-dependent receptor [Gammaproteobacteria bacterium]